MKMQNIISFFCAIILFSQIAFSQTIQGDLYPWHRVSIDFEGPVCSENGSPNPFVDYRLDVVFSGPEGQMYQVPGFFAADGQAAETSADSGNVWRVNFCPDMAGSWTYAASFVQGAKIAAEPEGGESAGFFDGQTGVFEVETASELEDCDLRKQGKLVYVNDHYLRFSESGSYFLKAGANSPEVFLEYEDFDNTPSTRTYSPHLNDWQEGDPVWQGGKGKGIIGVINYLGDTGVNALYFLTMNAYGDGKKAWPFVHQDSMWVYDCSKLDQWDIVFGQMTRKGVMPHFVLSETENESYFEIKEMGEAGGFAKSRKIYYREMIARFGYHPAVTWNIGEENGWADGSSFKIANTDQQRREAAEYIRGLTCYADHISIHNGPSTDDQIFHALLDVDAFTGPAFQWGYNSQIHGKILNWRNLSHENHPWVVTMDEAWLSPEKGNVDVWRKEVVWGTLMAGGAGVELYVGAGKDLSVQNYRLYETYYQINVDAVRFMQTHLPFYQMAPDDEFADQQWALVQPDSVYLIYLKKGGSTEVNLPDGIFNVHWFDPRNGGDLQRGTVWQLFGNSSESVGEAPSESDEDWLCLITRTDSLISHISSRVNQPRSFVLKPNYPNPFNPVTTIPFMLAETERVVLSIVDIHGKTVHVLSQREFAAGAHELQWHGTNDAGDQVASGIYFAQLKSGKQTRIRKIILTR